MRAMFATCFTAAAIIALPGCAQQANKAQHQQQEILALKEASAHCKADASLTTHVQRADCLTAAEQSFPAIWGGDADLLAVYETQRRSLASKIDAGELSADEARVQSAQDWSAAVSASSERASAKIAAQNVASGSGVSNWFGSCSTAENFTNCAGGIEPLRHRPPDPATTDTPSAQLGSDQIGHRGGVLDAVAYMHWLDPL